MHKFAPLTKLIITVTITIWAFILQDAGSLGGIVLGLTGVSAISRLGRKQYKAMLSLAVFATILGGFQYLFGSGLQLALTASLRMLIMTYLFLVLLATTRIQDLTAALVTQCRVPYDYAFMLTASLRFIPDLMAEIRAVQEAQACRGYSDRGSVVKRVMSYLSVVQPLVLRSISRSETMAMSLELRGFGNQAGRTFAADMSLAMKDYAMLSLLIPGTLLVLLR